MIYKYIMIVFLSMHLAYSYIMYAANDKIFKNMDKEKNKVSYVWNKKTRLALLLDEFASTDQCKESYEYLMSLINGTDLNPKPA